MNKAPDPAIELSELSIKFVEKLAEMLIPEANSMSDVPNISALEQISTKYFGSLIDVFLGAAMQRYNDLWPEEFAAKVIEARETLEKLQAEDKAKVAKIDAARLAKVPKGLN